MTNKVGLRISVGDTKYHMQYINQLSPFIGVRAWCETNAERERENTFMNDVLVEGLMSMLLCRGFSSTLQYMEKCYMSAEAKLHISAGKVAASVGPNFICDMFLSGLYVEPCISVTWINVGKEDVVVHATILKKKNYTKHLIWCGPHYLVPTPCGFTQKRPL
jgi:hypothetical protein